MDLKHLRTLLAVIECRSFTAAARRLGVTQAAVSQHVAQLEKELGVKLFDRGGRQVKLTAAGIKLGDYGTQILQLAEAAIAEVQGRPLPVAGVLQIATSTVPAATKLPQLLGEFQKRYPDVQTKLRISESYSTIVAVERGDADVGFAGLQPKSDKLTARCIAHDELVLVVSAKHELAQKNSISLKQLAETPLVVRQLNSGSRQCLEQALGERNLSLSDMKIGMETNSNDAIIAAVREGNGAAYLSAATVEESLSAGHLAVVKVRQLRPRRKLFLVFQRRNGDRQPLQAFLNFVIAETAQ